jgi:hypothetical protein
MTRFSEIELTEKVGITRYFCIPFGTAGTLPVEML